MAILKLTFNKRYFAIAVLLFLCEVYIAAFVNDTFIRPVFGDYLVVILVYCFIKSFFNMPVHVTALGTLLFSYLMEWFQYIHLNRVLGLENSKWAHLLMGSFFQWADIIAYTAGILTVVLVENRRRK
ncbi:DUF2809 domain-containing protein [Hufsiella ginkgonis]|uniref:DUF2809 domain-containing protein n=1 Tax=Hufsiella ginkgonis TaxID=2695274 RepID=A0A7K1XY54_9SPHI|nr:DUF2809 domain-containing protein [Hufsiella ginkgonis]MXV15679.1 DUF2809 domain-containing protein [Hufsiella ginkgonis]